MDGNPDQPLTSDVKLMLSEYSNSTGNQPMFCKVCGDPASGSYSISCNACRDFFNSTVDANIIHGRAQLIVLHACAWSGRCVVSGPCRVVCLACRFNRCLTVGMARSNTGVPDGYNTGSPDTNIKEEDDVTCISVHQSEYKLKSSETVNDVIKTKLKLKLLKKNPEMKPESDVTVRNDVSQCHSNDWDPEDDSDYEDIDIDRVFDANSPEGKLEGDSDVDLKNKEGQLQSGNLALVSHVKCDENEINDDKKHSGENISDKYQPQTGKLMNDYDISETDEKGDSGNNSGKELVEKRQLRKRSSRVVYDDSDSDESDDSFGENSGAKRQCRTMVSKAVSQPIKAELKDNNDSVVNKNDNNDSVVNKNDNNDSNVNGNDTTNGVDDNDVKPDEDIVGQIKQDDDSDNNDSIADVNDIIDDVNDSIDDVDDSIDDVNDSIDDVDNDDEDVEDDDDDDDDDGDSIDDTDDKTSVDVDFKTDDSTCTSAYEPTEDGNDNNNADEDVKADDTNNNADEDFKSGDNASSEEGIAGKRQLRKRKAAQVSYIEAEKDDIEEFDSDDGGGENASDFEPSDEDISIDESGSDYTPEVSSPSKLKKIDGRETKTQSNQQLKAKPVVFIQKLYVQFECVVPGCSRSYSSNKDMRRHLLEKHPIGTKKLYVCIVPGCGKNYRSGKTKRKHIREKHPDIAIATKKLYECVAPGCNRSFLKNKERCRHLRAVHPGIPWKSCLQTNLKCFVPGCDKSFPHNQDRNKHIRTFHPKYELPARKEMELSPGMFFVERKLAENNDIPVLWRYTDGLLERFVRRETGGDKSSNLYQNQPHACQAPDCSQRFFTENDLRSHKICSHGRKKRPGKQSKVPVSKSDSGANTDDKLVGVKQNTENDTKEHVSIENQKHDRETSPEEAKVISSDDQCKNISKEDEMTKDLKQSQDKVSDANEKVNDTGKHVEDSEIDNNELEKDATKDETTIDAVSLPDKSTKIGETDHESDTDSKVEDNSEASQDGTDDNQKEQGSEDPIPHSIAWQSEMQEDYIEVVATTESSDMEIRATLISTLDDLSNAAKQGNTDKEAAPKDSDFHIGQFLIDKNDLHNEDTFAVWKIISTFLIQKFEMVNRADTIYHTPLKTFCGYNDLNKNYVLIKVRQGHVRGDRDLIEVWKGNLPKRQIQKDLQEEYDNNSLLKHFTVYMQVLLSQAMEPSFLDEVVKTKVEDFVIPMQQIDKSVKQKLTQIEKKVKWTKKLKEAVKKVPQLREVSKPDSKQTCEAIERSKETVTEIAYLYGNPYNNITLDTDESAALFTQDFKIGKTAMKYIETYHRLCHFRFNHFEKCKAKIKIVHGDKEGGSNEKVAKFVDQCLNERMWLLRMFEDFIKLINTTL